MTATETARRAVAVTEKLSPAMRLAIRDAAEIDNVRYIGRVGYVQHRTITALMSRGLAKQSERHFHALTDDGRFVHAVIVKGAADVLAWAGRQDAAAYIGQNGDDLRTIGEAAAFASGDNDPAVAAFRAALLDELHAYALEENANRSEPGPHFCNPSCWESHATTWDHAGVAAETCRDAEHFVLYPDTTPESTSNHVRAHLPHHGPGGTDDKPWVTLGVITTTAVERAAVRAELDGERQAITEINAGRSTLELSLAAGAREDTPWDHGYRTTLLGELYTRALAEDTERAAAALSPKQRAAFRTARVEGGRLVLDLVYVTYGTAYQLVRLGYVTQEGEHGTGPFPLTDPGQRIRVALLP